MEEVTKREVVEAVSGRIRLLRESVGMSQGDFADALGVSRGYISNIENGKAEPTITLLWEIEREFGGRAPASMHTILFGEGPFQGEFNKGAVHAVNTMNMRALTCALKRADEMERDGGQHTPPHIKALLVQALMRAYVERYQQRKLSGLGGPDDWHTAAAAEVDAAARFPAE